MQFRLLGALRVTDSDGVDHTPSAPKMRQLLGLLVLRNNEIVPVESIIEELWGPHAPASAVQVVQTYVYKLRKILRRQRATQGDRPCVLHTTPGGYRLQAEPEQLDVDRFRTLVAKGEGIAENGPCDASEILARSLLLWRGPPLQDVEKGVLLSTYVAELNELMLVTRKQRLELDLALGRHASLISELRGLTAAYPFHEEFYGYLMLALHRSHRRYEALQTYNLLRQVMQDELALEPAVEVQRLHVRILNSDPALGWPDPTHVADHRRGESGARRRAAGRELRRLRASDGAPPASALRYY